MRVRRPWWLALLAWVCLRGLDVHWAEAAEPASEATLPVLRLDGSEGGYLKLPDGAFEELEESTIEAWVRPGASTPMRIFNFGPPNRDLGFGLNDTSGSGRSLALFFTHDAKGMTVLVPLTLGGLPTDEWRHLAVVMGKGGIRVHLQGMVVATNSFRGSFSQLGKGGVYAIGQAHFIPYFKGDIAEFRVWRTARTTQQIRADMGRRLTGSEDGLVALYDFADESGRVVPNRVADRHPATLVGSASLGREPSPLAESEGRLVLLTGLVRTREGELARRTTLRITKRGKLVGEARTDFAGIYRLSLLADDSEYRLEASREDQSLTVSGLRFSREGTFTNDLVLQQTPFIEGRVVGVDGQAVGGRRVELVGPATEMAESLGGNPGQIQATLTDPAGRYRFDALPAGRYRLRIAGATGGGAGNENGFAGDVGLGWIELSQATPKASRTNSVPVQPGGEPKANRVLRFAGGESHVVLPSRIFDSLKEATVEGWVKWSRFGRYMRFFDFGRKDRTLLLSNREDTGNLVFRVDEGARSVRHEPSVANVLETNRWYHLAVVLGRKTTTIYLNGHLCLEVPFRGGFAGIGEGETNYLGRSNWRDVSPPDEDFEGEMDEVRVWAKACSEEEIRGRRFERLTGNEPSLVARYGFDDGDARDGSPNRFDGQVVGRVEAVEAPFPRAGDEVSFGRLHVSMREANGTPAPYAGRVEIRSGGSVSREASFFDSLSHHVALVRARENPVDVRVMAGNRTVGTATNVWIRSAETNVVVEIGQERRWGARGQVQSLDGRPMEGVVVELREVPAPPAFSVESLHLDYFALTNATISEIPDLPQDARPVESMDVTEIALRIRGFWGFLTGAAEPHLGRWTSRFRTDQARRIEFSAQVLETFRFVMDGRPLPLTPPDGAMARTVAIDLGPGEHELRLEVVAPIGPNRMACVLRWRVGDGPWTIYSLGPPVTEHAVTDAEGVYNFGFGFMKGLGRIEVHGPGNHVPVEDGQAVDFSRTRAVELRPVSVAPFRKGTWRRIGREQGLENEHVRKMLPSRDGRMWFATEAGGVSVWDGRRISRLGRREGLSDEPVTGLAEDSRGRVWVVTGKSIGWRDPSGACVLEPGEVTFGAGMDPVLYVDRQDRAWVAGVNGIFRREGSEWRPLAFADGSAAGSASGFAEIGDGRMAVLHPSLELLEARDGRLVRGRMNDGAPRGLLPTSAFVASDGSRWHASIYGGFHRWDGRRWADWYFQSGVRGTVWGWSQGRNGGVWVATRSGAWHFDGRSWVRYSVADGLPSNDVRAIHEDEAGAIWFATHGGGVGILDPNSIVRYGKADGIPSDNVTALGVDDGGRLWVGSHEFDLLFRDGRGFRAPDPSHGLHRMRAVTMQWDRKERAMWLGTRQEGLMKWKDQTLKMFGRGEGVEVLSVDRILADRHGQVWMRAGAYHEDFGLIRWDGRRFEGFGVNDGLPRGSVRALAEDPRGEMWMLFYDGLFRWNGTEFRDGWDTEADRSDYQDALGRLDQLLAASDGSIWLGGGDIRIDNQATPRLLRRTVNGVRAYTPADGVGESVTCSFAEDSSGGIWVGHRESISRFDGHHWSVISLPRPPADPSLRLKVNALQEDDEGTMWAGTSYGLYAIRRGSPPARRPTLTVTADRVHDAGGFIPDQPVGRRLEFECTSHDLLTPSERQRFRHQVIAGTPGSNRLAKAGPWSAPVTTPTFAWSTNVPGVYTVAVQYIDERLHYSEPVLATMRVVLPWYRDVRVMGPVAAANLGLLVWAGIAGRLYYRKRREAVRLREQLLEEERRAREAAEASRRQIEERNRELAEARDAANQASQAKSTFLASMSHELRTPLTAILGFAEMLGEEATEEGREETARDLSRIHGSATHLLGLINGILDLSKIEARKMELVVERVKVKRMVEEVEATLRPLAGKKGNALAVELGEGVSGLDLETDGVKLRQCLLNLLSNANKFTEGGKVTLRVEREGVGPGGAGEAGWVRFEVEDTGIGMAEEQVGRLFRAFEQAGAETSRKYGGTGLGLVITKGFAELMGGSVGVRSVPGEGTTFVLRLPVRAPGAEGRKA